MPLTSSYSDKTARFLDLENEFSAHNYHPLPVVLSKGEGVHVWDVDGKKYYDFLSGYSALNQGHRHPKIMASLLEQAQRLTLTSRAFSYDRFGAFAQYFTSYFGYS
jgi:ornithine--oxo-acid transaminase